jgi:hypothetical protein
MEAEMKKISDEFNAQRAKLKDLYLQKEADCIKLSKELVSVRKELNDTKSSLVIAEINREKDLEDQGRRAQEEIQTLQTLVHETCDESTRSISEYKRLSDENEYLRQQILDLKAAAVQSAHHPVSNEPHFIFFFLYNQQKKDQSLFISTSSFASIQKNSFNLFVLGQMDRRERERKKINSPFSLFLYQCFLYTGHPFVGAHV